MKQEEALPQEIVAHVDERPCAAFFADIADKHFGLLVQTFDGGGGGFA